MLPGTKKPNGSTRAKSLKSSPSPKRSCQAFLRLPVRTRHGGSFSDLDSVGDDLQPSGPHLIPPSEQTDASVPPKSPWEGWSVLTVETPLYSDGSGGEIMTLGPFPDLGLGDARESTGSLVDCSGAHRVVTCDPEENRANCITLAAPAAIWRPSSPAYRSRR